MDEDDIIDGIRQSGRFDATVGSEADARRLVRTALPHAGELPPAAAGQPYPGPPPGVKAWFQVQPAEPAAGNPLPHVKYADWTGGKKRGGGSWGHVFFPPPTGQGQEVITMSVMFEVYYRPPVDPGREGALTELARGFGGRLDFREEPTDLTGVCLAFEFDDWPSAESAAEAFRARGEHVEGPCDYGP